MLNIQEVVNFLNENLNTDENITINVKAEVGESDKESLISGILRTANSKTTPITNYVENKYTFVVELSVPTGRTNKVFLKTQDIVGGFVDAFDGSKVDFTNGAGTINCSLGKPENFKVAYNVGDCTPLYFTIDMVYTESGVMSIDKKWYLSENGTTFYQIPYEYEDVVLNKEGITRKVDFSTYTKTYLTGQTKFYKFKFPYQNTELGNMLMKDILNGDFKKQYTLKYIDGINYTEDNPEKPPFTSKVSIFMSGDANSQPVNVGKFDLTFTDVDDGNTEVKYYIGMINWQFDLSGEDTKWFETQSAQQTYFNTRVTTANNGGTGWQQIKAPNLNSIFITSQVFPNESNMNIFDLARKNYAIIRAITGTLQNPTTDKWFFYGASNCQIGANGQVTYDLQEDTVQTIFMDSRLVVAQSFIERCHTNRYISNSDNTYSYNFRNDSLLFEKEQISATAKRPTSKNKLQILYARNEARDSEGNLWCNGVISHWVYIYLSHGEDYSGIIYPTTGDRPLPNFQYIKNGQSTYSELSVICYPVMKDTLHTLWGGSGIDNSTAYPLSYNAIEAFLKANNGYSHVYAVKNSIQPPFNDLLDYRISSAETTNDRMYLNMPSSNNTSSTTYTQAQWGCFAARINTDDWGIQSFLVLDNQNLDKCLDLYLNTSDIYTSKFTLQQAKDNLQEPKIFNEDYSIYHIYYGGQTYDMPISKTSPLPAFKYYEPLTPDVTKFYLAYDNRSPYGTQVISYTQSVFNQYNVKDYTGLVGTLDLSMWFSTGDLDAYLAQNKNNLQIFQNNQQLQSDTAKVNLGLGIVGSLTGGALGAAAGSSRLSSATNAAGMAAGKLTMAGSAIGAATGVAGSIAKYVEQKWARGVEATNRDLTLDNMRQAPASLSALNSNAILMQNVDDFGIYIEVQEPLAVEKQMIVDNLKRYGYSVNQLGYLNYYLYRPSGTSKILTRSKFVYIKAIISAMANMSMSTEERMDLEQRFESGIRFWNTEWIDYSGANYETTL